MWNQQRNFLYLAFVSYLSMSASAAAADGQIRLAGSGSTRCSGRVQIYHNNSWGTVCDDGWDLNDAEVVCRQLGCGAALDAPQSANFGQGSGPIWLDDVSCSGSETLLTQCQHRGFGIHNCGHGEDAGVICSGVPVRLSESTLCSGRVEILYRNSWGTVCDDLWDLNDAEVVCRELGCGKAKRAAVSAHFGQGSGQIWLNDVKCSGSERSLSKCNHRGFGTHNCTHSKDAGVQCSVILPKPIIYMNPVGEVAWGQDVSFTCSVLIKTQQLLHGKFILNQTSGSFNQTQTSANNSATFKIFKVDTDKEGTYQCLYSHNLSFSQSDSVSLSVIVPLQQPRIILTSLNGGLVWGPEGAEVTKGHSFEFTCSINTSYTSGRFVLIFSGSNITEEAVENSASFSFPAAEFEHQGNHSCVYEVTLSSRKFTSPEAAPIHVIIIFPWVLLVSSVLAGILLLLVVLLVVYLVLKRRQQAQQHGAHIQTQMIVMNSNKDDEDDGERDYVNMEKTNTEKNFTKQTERGKEEKRDEFEYENMSGNDNYIDPVEFFVSGKDNRPKEDDKEESSDEENDYVNVSKPFSKETANIDGDKEGIYQNFKASID